MEMQNETFKHYINIAFQMPLSQLFPWKLRDENDLPGEIKVSYQNNYGPAHFRGLHNFVYVNDPDSC